MIQNIMDSKTEKIAGIIRSNHSGTINKILVVGCGSGIEAAILSQQLGARVVGVDIDENFSKEAIKYAELRQGDAMALEFQDESFDFVYSYHALEHISNPLQALQEMNRVLKLGGGYMIGTPRRTRIIGYLGSKNATFSTKLKWNINDWKAKLAGKFRNELGAHAGFSSAELRTLLNKVFHIVNEVSLIYYYAIYEKHHALLKLINSSWLSKYIYPGVYFMGAK